MNKFVELLKELATTNSNKDKEIILAKYDDPMVKDLLKRTLDPYQNHFIKKLKPFDATKYRPEPNFDVADRYNFLIGLLNDLKGRYVTGNLARDTVEATFSLFDEDEYEAYSKVLLKKSIGVGEATVNKVFKDLIPVFNIMLAPSELADLNKIKYPCEAQYKLDGFRALFIPDRKQDKILSRSGLPIENKNLEEYLKVLQNVDDYVLDGELYSHEVSFEELSSVLNSEDKEIPKSVKFVVYDCLTLKEWNNKACTTNYTNRLRKAREIVQSDIGDRTKVSDIVSKTCNNAKEVLAFYKEALDKGYEGLMLKDKLGYYKFKRVTNKSGECLKLKPFKSADLPIVGFYEGKDDTKYKGTLGGIDVDFNGVIVSVGSGIKDELRDKIWHNKQDYLGKVVEIKYFEETEDGSLRHPTFFRLREDKSLTSK